MACHIELEFEAMDYSTLETRRAIPTSKDAHPWDRPFPESKTTTNGDQILFATAYSKAIASVFPLNSIRFTLKEPSAFAVYATALSEAG